MRRRARQRQAGEVARLLFGIGVGVAGAQGHRVDDLPVRRQLDALQHGIVDVVAVPEPVVRVLLPARDRTIRIVDQRVRDLVLEVGVEIGGAGTEVRQVEKAVKPGDGKS